MTDRHEATSKTVTEKGSTSLLHLLFDWQRDGDLRSDRSPRSPPRISRNVVDFAFVAGQVRIR